MKVLVRKPKGYKGENPYWTKEMDSLNGKIIKVKQNNWNRKYYTELKTGEKWSLNKAWCTPVKKKSRKELKAEIKRLKEIISAKDEILKNVRIAVQ